jgi:hypothetical protein
MIVRERPDSYVIIRQHDHGQLSGRFALHWAESPRPFEPTIYAITNHDLGWQFLDRSVRWDEASGKPYSFTNYPTEPKLRAYKEGLRLLRNPYATCLCSMHYTSFMQIMQGSEDAAEVRFREIELRRQEMLKGRMSVEELENLDHNFRLLQLCDNLSLFVCLNEPGSNEHPWYKNGFSFAGERFEPVWEDRRTLRLKPNPFSEPFDLVAPYGVIDRDGRLRESGYLELRVTC